MRRSTSTPVGEQVFGVSSIAGDRRAIIRRPTGVQLPTRSQTVLEAVWAATTETPEAASPARTAPGTDRRARRPSVSRPGCGPAARTRRCRRRPGPSRGPPRGRAPCRRDAAPAGDRDAAHHRRLAVHRDRADRTGDRAVAGDVAHRVSAGVGAGVNPSVGDRRRERERRVSRRGQPRQPIDGAAGDRCRPDPAGWCVAAGDLRRDPVDRHGRRGRHRGAVAGRVAHRHGAGRRPCPMTGLPAGVAVSVNERSAGRRATAGRRPGS